VILVNEFVSYFVFASIFVVLVSSFVLFYGLSSWWIFFIYGDGLASWPKNHGYIFFIMGMFVFLCFGYGLYSHSYPLPLSITVAIFPLNFFCFYNFIFSFKGLYKFDLINSFTFLISGLIEE